MDDKEMLAMEEKCIQEHAPACTAACPIHVDVRKMIEQIANKKFDAAFKTFHKKVPFPRIISRICSHPCQQHCIRGEKGGAILIAELEKICVDFGKTNLKLFKSMIKKDKRIAIIGGGLSGLTAALYLNEKGYDLEIFEKRSQIGGSVLNISEELLPRYLIEEDFDILDRLNIKINTNKEIKTETDFSEILSAFDVVYIGTGKDSTLELNIEKDNKGCIMINDQTYETSRKGIFAGGSLKTNKNGYDPLLSIIDGKQAAISIDRYFKKASLTISREYDGCYDSQLYVNLEGIEEAAPIIPKDIKSGYTKEEAVQEALRCIQCSCLECVKECKYLEHFKGYPKKYIREIANNLVIVIGLRMAKPLVNSCMLCGLCEEICHNQVNMSRICKYAREKMVKTDHMPPPIHDFPINDMLFSNSDRFALYRHQPGLNNSDFAFFPGCQLAASRPDAVIKSYQYLTDKLDNGVGLFLRCCGAPAEWAGKKDIFDQETEDFYDIWKKAGSPKLVLACSTCYQMIKTYFPDIPIVSLWEVYDQYGLPEETSNVEVKDKVLTIHDACTTRYEPQIHDSVRSIINQLGYSIEELAFSKDKTKCCGYGGLVSFANPELTDDIIKSRISESERDYVAYCAICRDYFAGKGKATWHLLDLIYGSKQENAALKKGPGYSQKRENRIKLRSQILRELWGEVVESNREDFEKIQLVVSEEVKDKMEERLILLEDIQRVIEHAERTGAKVYDPEKDCFIAYYKPGIITYWAEYKKEGEQYIVLTAYSHRIEIAEDVKES